jgi:LuxR family maltose regulon positive regulatory protein
LAVFQQGLNTAEPEGFVRTFLDEGSVVVELLKNAKSNGIAVEYTYRLLLTMESGVTPDQLSQQPVKSIPDMEALGLIEPLSERELQVLRLMDSELASPEIAEELVIAVSTVRSHIKNIYSKLGVHSRYEAVEKARSMDII